jgi:hypothetical protein
MNGEGYVWEKSNARLNPPLRCPHQLGVAVFFLLPFPIDLSLDWALNQLFEAALEVLFLVAGKGFFASLGVAGFFLGVAIFFFSDVDFLVCGFGFC